MSQTVDQQVTSLPVPAVVGKAMIGIPDSSSPLVFSTQSPENKNRRVDVHGAGCSSLGRRVHSGLRTRSRMSYGREENVTLCALVKFFTTIKSIVGDPFFVTRPARSRQAAALTARCSATMPPERLRHAALCHPAAKRSCANSC